MLLGVTACAGWSQDRLVYQQQGIRIGLEHDPSTDRTAAELNSHPAELTPEHIRTLLTVFQVTGYSGTISGLLLSPRPIPLLSQDEVLLVATPLAAALRQAGPRERVFFSIPKLDAPYSEDRTAGAMFVRGSYLHVILTDHAAFPRTDTAGGEDLKDPRDTKGMQLWVASPASAASLRPEEMPRWGLFEKVHVSLNIQEALAAKLSHPAPSPASELSIASQEKKAELLTADSIAALHLQIRELTSSNLELRARLEQQTQEMQQLKEELARMQRELATRKTPTRPRSKSSSP
jgi:hypothetical protein